MSRDRKHARRAAAPVHHHGRALRWFAACTWLAAACSSGPQTGASELGTSAAPPAAGGAYGTPGDGYGAGSGYEPGSAAADVSAQPAPAKQATAALEPLRGTLGSEGGELAGQPGTPFEHVRLVIPKGALGAPTRIEIAPAADSPALPASAVRCGPMFALTPAGLELALPASLTLPVDPTLVADQNRFDDEVKVWAEKKGNFAQKLQTASDAGSVTVDIDHFGLVAAGVNPPEEVDMVRFSLVANPQFAACLAQFPNDARRAPEAEVTVVRGAQNDGLFLRARNLRGGLAFSLFTVERSQLNARGAVDPRFSDFGAAIYHSDFDADQRGNARTAMRSILLDKGFVFDQGNFGPASTFHVGFWFDDPNDAADCGFNPERPTPFNEEHEAGPMAMISLPGRGTGLGPLCTKPDVSGETPRCLIE